MLTLKDKIIDSITYKIDYLKSKPYYSEINAFCLYTDEDFMSLTLAFNTVSFYQRKHDADFPLTYKFLPSEWFSESLRIEDDNKIYENHFFKAISSTLQELSLAGGEPNIHSYLLDSMKFCIDNDIFPKNEDTIYLIMKSDCFSADEILESNLFFNSDHTNQELIKFVNTEL